MSQTHRVFEAVLRRPVAATMVFALLILLGVIAYRQIPIALLPKGFQSPSLFVSIPYPGGTPRDSERSVAIPAEESLRTIPGVRRIRSFSSSDQVQLSVEFGWQADMELAYAEVADRLERARPSWPDGVDDYFVFRFNTNTDLPIHWFALLYDEGADDPHALYENVLQPALEAIDGVARLQVHGLPEQWVRVMLDRDRVEASRVSLFDLAGRLRGQHFALPAGELDADGREYLVRVDAKIKEPDGLLGLRVRDELTVGDLTERAYLGEDDDEEIARIDGRQALVVAVSKTSTANTVDVGRRVEQTLDDLKQHPRLAGIEIMTFFSQKETILNALAEVRTSAWIGGLLAVLILNFFLRRLRLTVVVALAIPTSIVMALVVLYFQGRSFNVLSLAGFTLAVGMLVDNAIVVVENIARNRARGLRPFEAAARGAGEIALAITMATATTIVVFVPLVFMSSDRNTRIILSEVASPISFSLLASLFTALVFLPLVALRLLRSEQQTKPPRFQALADWIRRPLRFSLHHRFAALMCFFALLGTMQLASKWTKKGFEGGDGEGELGINLRFQTGFTMADADHACQVIEDYLQENEEAFGVEHVTAFANRRGGRVTAYFAEDVDAETRLGLPGKIRAGLPEQAGVRTRVGREDGAGRGDVRVEIRGRDTDTLTEVAEELVDLLAASPQLLNVRSDVERGVDEVRIQLDREQAQRMDVPVDALRGAVAWGLAGVEVAELELERREVPVRLEYSEEEESNLEDLRAFGLPSDRGVMVPLQQLAEVEVGKAPGTIVRSGGRTVVGITATPATQDRALVTSAIREVMEGYSFPEGTSWVEDEGMNDFEDAMKEIFRAFFLAVVLVFLLMGILFESAFLPLAVLPAIPAAILGAFWALAITRVPLDATGMAGLVILAGIVVNNAIVLVDQINRNRRAEGMDRERAILEAARTRLRPILMTALTTIAGLIPMAMPMLTGGSRGVFSYQALAVCVLGGLVFSTLVTPFAIPLFYTLFDDLGRGVRALLSRASPVRATRTLELDRA